MIKRITVVIIGLLILCAASYTLHNYMNTSSLSFSLLSVYGFHALAAILVYITVEAVASKLPNQAGYAYLMMIFIKIGIFVLIFKNTLFSNTNLLFSERIALIIPLFIFLIAETIAVFRLLNTL
ncbi:hypothetical protein MHTCC0001_27980 [Flavobacteriaceae bacterium MHTCC 0001]